MWLHVIKLKLEEGRVPPLGRYLQVAQLCRHEVGMADIRRPLGERAWGLEGSLQGAEGPAFTWGQAQPSARPHFLHVWMRAVPLTLVHKKDTFPSWHWSRKAWEWNK